MWWGRRILLLLLLAVFVAHFDAVVASLNRAASEGGRGPSIWDTFAHRYPGMKFFLLDEVAVWHFVFNPQIAEQYLSSVFTG
ncbi:Beta-glucosidase 10 [Senna tora]|uniref:Beta-glucosidase 10 n=1 Tax=Senna tora TaxID=362788 RepID=A0A834SQ72_9FABA|nr:Beta-glucosidase 10 [Senna tora]